MVLGTVMVGIGFVLFLNPIISANWGAIRVPCLSPFLIPLGIVMVVVNLVGYVREKRHG